MITHLLVSCDLFDSESLMFLAYTIFLYNSSNGGEKTQFFFEHAIYRK